MSEDVRPYGADAGAEAARTNEFRDLMAQLGLSQRETADALEVDQRTLRYWASQNPAPPLMAIYAMRYLDARKSGRITELDLRPGAAITPDLVASKVADGDAGGGPGRGRPGNR